MKEFKIIYYNLCCTSLDFSNFRDFTKSLGFNMELKNHHNTLKNAITLKKNLPSASNIEDLKTHLTQVENYIKEFNLNFKCIKICFADVPIILNILTSERLPETYQRIDPTVWKIFYSTLEELFWISKISNSNREKNSPLVEDRLCTMLEL